MTKKPAESALKRTLHAAVALPLVYDVVQRLAGREEIYRRMEAALRGAEGALVLDAGAGTGKLVTVMPGSARYLWLDSDPQKLRGFSSRSTATALLGDATRIPLRDGAVDWAVSVGVSHHLGDEQLGRMLDELRRVVQERLVFLDAVATTTAMSRALWRYDRGAYPRRAEDLKSELATRFEVITAEEFKVRHEYLLVAAKPVSR